ncbi:IclR family transcriptional regulator [Cohnella sp. AR92]|uniref:IclR family transcriptional regulator n=1 Tax=Cohnella sp. AR92 TaxID=648716 RepID=UPI000F8D02CB|nr:IclR family transcriptional regulator [Cohnella sp. AR92]RUS43908.1 IclR family transcriptional regulator [Cohnella sp. AR92]
MTEKSIQSVDRALAILELFLGSSPELSVKEISLATGLSKSTAHGIIRTLERGGYLQQNPADLKYKLGMKLFRLGNAFAGSLEIGGIARPILRDLADRLKETVHLVVRQQDEAIYVDKVEGPQSLRIYSHVGKRAPWHCTGVAKAILAYQDEDTVDRLLAQAELQPFTKFTITDVDQLREQMRHIRENGFALDNEEIELGLRCVAAPIFDHQGQAVASVSCSIPSLRLDETKLPEVVRTITRAAAGISRGMGYLEQP